MGDPPRGASRGRRGQEALYIDLSKVYSQVLGFDVVAESLFHVGHVAGREAQAEREAAVKGGELPSNWEKMETSREDVVERLETLCDDLKTKVGQSFLSRVDAAIDTEAPGVVINRGLIVQSTSTMSADAYGNLLRSGRRAK